ncbi:hypothetical protein D3C87_1201200 [compost metagenome]
MACRIALAIFRKKIANGKNALKPCFLFLGSIDYGQTPVTGVLQPQADGLVWREDFGGDIRPLDQADTVFQHLVDAEFVQFRDVRQSVQIKMGNGNTCWIGLDDRECGAWNFKIRCIRHRPDEGAGESGFARAEISDQREAIASSQSQRQIFA